jgi:hypothetical protein
MDMALVLERHTGGNAYSATVTTADQEIVAVNPNRRYLLVQNDSDTTVYLSLNGAAVVGSGIRLNANGGSYEVNFTNLYTGAVNAIHDGAGDKNMCIQESP